MRTLFIMNRKKDIILALVLTLFLITLAICLTVFFKPLYYYDIYNLNICNIVNMDVETIKKNYDILIQYQSIFYQGELNLPNFIMSTHGRIHFEEVKVIFGAIQILCITTAVISIYLIRSHIKEKEYEFLKLTSIFAVTIPAFIGMLASINFDKAFVIFHKIFFRNDFWIFDYRTDPVITILPQDFFMHCFMMIIGLIIVFSVICYILYRRKRKQILGV